MFNISKNPAVSLFRMDNTFYAKPTQQYVEKYAKEKENTFCTDQIDVVCDETTSWRYACSCRIKCFTEWIKVYSVLQDSKYLQILFSMILASLRIIQIQTLRNNGKKHTIKKTRSYSPCRRATELRLPEKRGVFHPQTSNKLLCG